MKSIIARIPIRDGKMDEAVAVMKQLIEGVRGEDGTLFYTLNVAESAPNVLVVMERYLDDHAVQFHMGTPHFEAFSAKGADLFAGQPEIVIMDELASI